MLYLAIRTILDGEGFADKSKLANVLLAAILINFSLFATKAAFTISNSVATEIKSKIVINETGGVAAGATTTASTNAHSLSAGIARTLGIPKTVEYISDESLGGSKNLSDYQAIQFQYMLMLTFSVIGVGFILVAGALMLLYRFIMFIFLIILAPIGLVCFFIPWLKKYGQEWVDKVKALTLMAPVYFLSFYVSMLLLSQVVALGNVTTGGFVAALVQMATQTLLIAGTLFATIMLPIKVSSAGGEFIGNMGKWTEGKFRSLGKAPQQAALWGARKSGEYTARGVGRIGRSTIGKGADRFLKNNEWLKRNVTEAGIGGAVARGVARRAGDLATSSFDPRSVKIGGKAIGEKMGIGKPTKGQEDGYRGVATAKAKDIKKRFDSDMKIFGDAYEAKEKESRRENAKRASTEVDAAKNKIIQMQISGANQDDLTKAQMEVDSAKKKHAEALKMLDFKQNKIGNKEKGKLYAGVLDSDRNSKWNKFVNIFDEGRRRSMKEGIKIINKEKTKNEEAAEALAKAIKDGNN
jgi:hypothetical protein